MGKKLAKWTPPDEAVLVEEQSSNGKGKWTPPKEAEIVDSVKKKGEELPLLGGKDYDAGSSTPGTPSGQSTAKKQPTKESPQPTRVRDPRETIDKKFEEVLFYQIPSSIVSSAAAGLGVIEEIIKYPEKQLRSTGALPVNYSEKAAKEINEINDRVNRGFARLIDRGASGKLQEKDKETFLNFVSQANERINFLNKNFKPAFRNDKITQWQKGLINWAVDRSAKGQQISKGLVNKLSDINDPLDAINWAMGAVTESGVQIPAAIATYGTSAIGQEIGSVYMDAVVRIAQERGLTPQEVIAQDLDSPAAALAYGTTAGLMDYFGAKGVMGNIGKAELKQSLKQRSLRYLKEFGEGAVPESGTELSQTLLEQVGTGISAGNVKIDFEELGEAAARAAVGGGAMRTVSTAISDRSKPKTEIIKEQSEQVDANNPASIEQAAEQIEKEVNQPETKTEDAVQVVSTEEVLQQQQEDVGGEGSERGGVESVQQGEDTTGASVQEGETVRPTEEAQATEQVGESQEQQGEVDAIVEQGKKIQEEVSQIKEKWFTKKGEFKKNTPQKVIDRSRELQSEYDVLKSQYNEKKLTVDFTDRPFAERQFQVGELQKEASKFYNEETGEPKSDVNFEDVQSNYNARIEIEKQDYLEGRYGQVGSPIAETRFESAVEEVNNEFSPFQIQKVVPEEQTAALNILPDQSQSREGIAAEEQTPVTDEEQTQRREEGDEETLLTNEQPVQIQEEKSVQPAVPPAPPKDKKPTGKKPKGKQRKFAKQVLKDPNISDEVKKGLSDDAKTYIPKALSISNADANAIIEVKGEQQAMEDFFNQNNEMRLDVRNTLGQNLVRRFNKNQDWENAVKVVESLAKTGTEYGRAINSFKAFQLLTPEGVLLSVQKEITKAKTKYAEQTSENRKRAKDSIDKINEEAVGKILKNPKVKNKIISEVKKGSIKKAIDFLEGLKIDTKGKALDVTYGLAASAWNGLISAVQKGLQAGLTISQAINRAMAKTDKTNKEWDRDGAKKFLNEQLKDYKVTLDPESAIKEELKEQNQKIEDIIREHYTVVAEKKRSLIDKLMKEANIDKASAETIAKDLSNEFDRLTKEAKRKALDKHLPKASKKAKDGKKKRKELIDQIIEESNLGSLDDADIREAISEKIGIPSMTDQQAQELTRLADKVQTAKEGFDKNRATENLLNYVAKLAGIKWTDVAMSIWYANILSGLSTQMLNISANFFETMGEVYTAAVLNPKETGWIMKGLFNGWGRGMLEAMDTLQHGYQPAKFQAKISASPTLERFKFKGGKWNPYNYLKYVSRIMNAADIFFYHGINEMRARELAVSLAKKEGKNQPTREIIKKATEMIYQGVNPYQEAREQAIAEGFTGKEQKRRAYEILEQKRPEFIIKDSNDEAARGTFNYDPEGTLGAMTSGINYMINKIDIMGVKPLKFIIPFTRIIANVTNRYLDWTPVGLLRAAKGGIGFESLGENFHRKYTPQERQEVFVRAMTGVIGMIAMYALTDEEDGIFEITADGTGDLQKSYELQETGWRPYSIKIDGTWYEYRNTPLAIPFATIGFLRDAEKYRGEKDIATKSSIVLFGTMKYVMDLSFLQSLSSFMDTFSKENRAGAKNFFRKTARSVETGAKSFIVPNAFTQVSRSIQEVMEMPIKRADQVGDQVIRDMPILRDHLGNIYDALGDPVVPNQIERFLPLKPSRESQKVNDVWKLIADNNAWIGKPRRATQKLNGDTLTDEEYEKYALMAGKLTKQYIMEEYEILKRIKSKELVREEIGNLKAQARKDARELLFGF